MFGTPTTPIATDTVIPNFPYYFRLNPDTNKHEMNQRISAKNTDDNWVLVPHRAHNYLCQTTDLQLGELVNIYVSEARAADAWMEKHDTIRQAAFDAIRIIGERLIQESNDRNWCSEFDQIIDDVNSSLPAPFLLPVREREYNVSWSETYTITVRRYETVTARNEEDACNLVDDMIGEADEYTIRDAISYGNYDFSDDNGDFEAEEA